jgi:hypothetical protein
MRRALLITIEGPDKALVDRAADLLQEDLRSSANFITGLMDYYGSPDGATADDPLPESTPTITVTHVPAHLGGSQVLNSN